MRTVRLLACLPVMCACADAAVPCPAVDGKNASALCISLTIKKGQIAPKEFTFAPTSAYKANSGPRFFLMAQKEIASLAKPCDPLLAHGAKPAPAFCAEDADWATFLDAFRAHAETLDRTDLLTETGAFRPLAIAYHHSPLLWAENGSSLNAEAGIVTFFIADPIDPRTNDTFPIELRGVADDDTRNRRIVKIHQALAPLRRQVFCHDRIRARIQAFYKTLRIPIEIIQLDPQGPLLVIQEKP
ncbi:MAG: hypothetical protein ACKV2U_04655 [Bryobacteraceae bacterium]